MNNRRYTAVMWSVGLILTGIILLLFNFGFLLRFEPFAQYVVATLLALAGVGFFGSYLQNRSLWWRLIPGWTLVSVATMLLLTTTSINTMFIPAALFFGLALAFGNIYLINRKQNWWSIIPGGFLLVLGIVIGLNAYVDNLQALFAMLLVGMGIVFLVLAAVGPPEVRWWPLIPGLALVLFGLSIVSGAEENRGVVLRLWPLILVALGLVMGWRAWAIVPAKEKLSVNVAPGMSQKPADEVRSTARVTHGDTSRLGDYSGPAPGASVELLSDYDE